MATNDTYYKDLFKKYYRTAEEAEIIGEHTYNFAYKVINNPSILDPLYKFFVNLIFDGANEFTEPLASKILKEQCFTGNTKVDIDNFFNSEIIRTLTPQVLNESDDLKESIYDILEDIRKKDSEYIFYELDWDFFILQMNSMNAFHIFKTLNTDYNLTSFGTLFKDKAEKYGMKITISGIPEDDIDNLVNNSSIKDKTQIKKILSTKICAFLDFLPLGDFDKKKGPRIIKLTEQDLKKYENN